jgi:acyl-CoA synthetase (AMP-forming)/AMP-acid ligase II
MDDALFARPLASMAELLALRADQAPDASAFTYLPEREGDPVSVTFAQARQRAHAVAAELTRHAAWGDRALLLFPPGLDCVVAFLACLSAGIVAVPMMVPRRVVARDSSAAILTDCEPSVILTSPDLLDSRPDLTDRFQAHNIAWLSVDATRDRQPVPPARMPGASDIALLQYTSGSTSTPKGVVVSHGNILANIEMIRRRMENPARATSVNWVPLYHDMGLMMGVMLPLYLGGHSILMAPTAFMRRPLTWPRTIHKYRAAISSAPNFAYDLCASRARPEALVDLDLSCWTLALNGAEPVNAATIDRFTDAFAPRGFAPGTMYPGYGLAEATLLVTGGHRGSLPVGRSVSRDGLRSGRIAPPRDRADSQLAISSGLAVPGSRMAIVDPNTGSRVPPLIVGEVWVGGPHVAQGYWRKPEATAETFAARIPTEGAEPWLRTGDLGFLDANGALFLTSRIKDLIIIRGVNHYPQDIERTVQDSHPAMRRDCGAAFPITDQDGTERLVIVQEVERTRRQDLDAATIARAVREAVTMAHDIAVHAIVFIRPASLPKTTSGKIQRGMTRLLWQQGGLDVIGAA